MFFRWINNLVETVKGYAAHEKEAFEKVVAARAKATSATGVHDVAAADGALTQALRGLLAVAEAYPDLKASANFLQLQDELATTENKVAFSRQFYNDSVRSLNQTIKPYRDWETDRKSTRLNSSHLKLSRMPSSA